MHKIFALLLIPTLLFPNNSFVQEHENYIHTTRGTAIAFGAFCFVVYCKITPGLLAKADGLVEERKREELRKKYEEEREKRAQEAEDHANDERCRNERNVAFIQRLEDLQHVDLYARLELDRHASRDDIAQAYNRLNRRHHPDLVQRRFADAEPEVREREIAAAQQAAQNRFEAHDILTNPAQRQLYDIARANPRNIGHRA